MDLIDWLVPQAARQDARRRIRHRGIAKALLSISLVAGLLLAGFVAARGAISGIEYAAFAGAIGIPVLGALLIRFNGNITAGLLATNIGGVLIVALWAWATGGIESVALPIFLGNLALLATFGNTAMLYITGTLLLAALAVLYLATARGWLPPNLVAQADAPLLMLMSMAAAVIVIVLAASLVVRDRAAGKARLRAARDAAQRANDAKSVFLSSVSHELRTPLNAILGFTEILRIDSKRPLDPVQSGHLAHIAQAGAYLHSLVNQVLDMNAIEAGAVQLRPEPVALDEVLEDCWKSLAPAAQARGMRLESELARSPGARVYVDRGRLRQVLLSLLSNAIKYGARNGAVTVHCVAAGEGRLRVSVSDRGAGIAPSRQGEIFSPFARLGAESSAVEGAGLGLVLAKRLTEMMGGSIGFESREGEGSTFWVEFPVAARSSH